MVTIYRAFGLRVVIFIDDHEPAHVHVFGDGEVKINLSGYGGEPELVWAMGAKRNEVRRAMALKTWLRWASKSASRLCPKRVSWRDCGSNPACNSASMPRSSRRLPTL